MKPGTDIKPTVVRGNMVSLLKRRFLRKSMKLNGFTTAYAYIV